MSPEFQKEIHSGFDVINKSEDVQVFNKVAESLGVYESLDNLDKVIKNLEKEMKQAAKALEFERAAELRDRIKLLKQNQ